jgi:hypothetical protein
VFVVFPPAVWCFISAVIVIVASSIAARAAAKNPAVSSAARPTAVTSRHPGDVTIIATASASTESANVPA